MLKNKQVKESKAIKFINKLIKSGRILKRTVYNGQPSKDKYVMIEWLEPKELCI